MCCEVILSGEDLLKLKEAKVLDNDEVRALILGAECLCDECVEEVKTEVKPEEVKVAAEEVPVSTEDKPEVTTVAPVMEPEVK